ncbi:hypothetical protein BDV41DRAFT_422449 [Aspergillus transmontanensis]|uniref:Uncharacterized protein n=1 Tax=Aspergillus transmontanensis TaxID=1034304 RepID=A0A5N6VNG9_9EURO|nr:hypothetical protein BDV41DRAFT_422449 [Aspergillus transmontanensis]
MPPKARPYRTPRWLLQAPSPLHSNFQDVQANCHPLHSASPHQEDQTVPRACLLPQEQRVSPSHPPSPQPQAPQAVSHPSPTCRQETSPSLHHQAASPRTSKSHPPALPVSPQCPVPSLANLVSAPVLPPVSPVPRAKRAGMRPRLVQAQRVSPDRHRDWASLVDLFRGWMGMSNYWGFMLGVYAANLNYTLLCCFLYFVFVKGVFLLEFCFRRADLRYMVFFFEKNFCLLK